MLSLSQELNEALDLWASLLPKIQTTPSVERNQTEPVFLKVPDSLPLLRSMGHFFQQTAWLGEPVLEAEEKPKETPASFTSTPLQNSVVSFFENTHWHNRENLLPGRQEGQDSEPRSALDSSGMRLAVDAFFRETPWQGISRQETDKNSVTSTLSLEAEKATDIDHFFEDIRW
jgi:hypothetical protein